MKITTYLLLFICLISSQSCFEIVEQIIMKNDGTGSFELIVNMSKSKTKLASFEKMKTVNGKKVPSRNEVKNKITEAENIIKKTPGITAVKTVTDFDNYIVTFNCNFNKVANLNNVIKAIGEAEKANKKFTEKSYDYDIATKTFTRWNKLSVKEDYNKLSSADKEIFAGSNFTSIIRFENDINTSSNKESKMAANKKAIMLKQNILDIITNKKTIENSIKLIK